MSRLIVITGASSGIGRETALLLATPGNELVLAARRAQPLRELADECRALGGNAVAAPCDLSSVQECERLILEARDMGIGEPVLINSAGVAEFGSFDEMAVASLLEQVVVNYLAPMYLCHASIPWMLEGGGQIINVGSIAAVHVFSGSAAYSSAKAGLLMLGRTLAAEYRSRGVRVTTILPGSVDTPLWDAQNFQPERGDMLPARAVAETIRDLVLMPKDRNVDEVRLMPPKGIL